MKHPVDFPVDRDNQETSLARSAADEGDIVREK